MAAARRRSSPRIPIAGRPGSARRLAPAISINAFLIMTPSSGLNTRDRGTGWSLRSRWVDNTTLSLGPFHAAGLMGEVKRNPEFIGGGKSLVGENIVMTAAMAHRLRSEAPRYSSAAESAP